jgi:hypothetical protein
MSVHVCIVFNAMLVSHGPLNNVSHGEKKGSMGFLIILVCILEGLAHELQANLRLFNNRALTNSRFSSHEAKPPFSRVLWIMPGAS